MSYEYIEPLEEKPEIGRRIRRKCIAGRILKEFKASEVKYAKVKMNRMKNLSEDETVLDCIYCLSLCERRNPPASFPQYTDILVYSDSENIYLERV